MKGYSNFLYPPNVLFSNELLEDLEKIWALRFVIPDPKNPKCTKEGKYSFLFDKSNKSVSKAQVYQNNL